MNVYENEKYKNRLKTRYTLEYIDNKEDMNYLQSGKTKPCEPWEMYKKMSYDNIDRAMEKYVLYLLNPSILDVKLFEEILIDGETVREAYVEPNSAFSYSLKTAINKNMYEDTKKANDEVDALEKRSYLIEKWMNEYKYVKESFDKFVHEIGCSGKKLTAYRYYSVLRPVSLGTYPRQKEAKNIVNFDDRTYIDDINRFAWGYIEYEEELEWTEAESYDLEWNRYTKTEVIA